jgi:hypothetical protein
MIQTENSIPQNDHPTPNSLYLIGTGFSKGICPRVPLNNELLPELLKCKYSPELEEYSTLYPTDNIEELLTWLDIKSAKSKRVGEARKRINDALAQYFSQFCISAICDTSKKWLKRFAEEVLQPNDAIVSLNYDCLLEGALDSYGVWTPNGGYYYVTTHPHSTIPKNPNGLLLYKLHGSVSFKESPVLKTTNQTGIGVIITEELFPVSGKLHYHDFGGPNAPTYLIAPSFVKIQHHDIRRIMLEVLKIAESSSRLVIIGCGMRPEDSFLRLMIASFYKQREKRLTIVDPEPYRIKNAINESWKGDGGVFLDPKLIAGGIETAIDELLAELAP